MLFPAMNTADLIASLSLPEAWPQVPGRVEVVQTHASVVFLGADEVYKLKKPVDFGFLDYSSLEKRRRACEAEVALNRRLAPEVYLGVVPITAGPRFGGEGEPLEWAVHMRRLPEDRTLGALLADGACDAALLARLAEHLAVFFRDAEDGPDVARSARFDVVAGHLLQNFEQVAGHGDGAVAARALERFRELTANELANKRGLIESRASRGLARDGHGDLRLDHVYLLDEEFVIVDCIEFNDSLRHQDPVCDVAFLVMELVFADRPDLAESFADAFFEASHDDEGRALLPLFVAYRQAVRGKVRLLEADDEGLPADQRALAASRARRHVLQGLAGLAPPNERPALLLVGGPPASGKSTLSRALAVSVGFERVSSDETRKRLAGVPALASAAAAPGEGLYTTAWTDRTYDACLREARQRLATGRRVVVDASFGRDARRLPFLRLARELGVPAVWFDLELEPEAARRRLRARGADASDADELVQERLRQAHEPPGEESAVARRALPSAGSPDELLASARTALAAAGLDIQRECPHGGH